MQGECTTTTECCELYDFRASCQISHHCRHPHCRDLGSWSGPGEHLNWRPVAELYYFTIMPGSTEYQIDARSRLNGKALLPVVGLDVANAPKARKTRYVRSPKGSGKTHTLKKVLAEIHTSFSVLVVSGLCSLADMYMGELNADAMVPFEDYRTLGNNPFPAETRRMVCSLESIWKVGHRPHVVILDESETILSRLPGATFDKGGRTPALTRLREVLSAATVVLALDPDLGHAIPQVHSSCPRKRRHSGPLELVPRAQAATHVCLGPLRGEMVCASVQGPRACCGE